MTLSGKTAWVVIALLVVSLAGNAFVIGQHMARDRHRGMGPGEGRHLVRHMWRSLPPQVADQVKTQYAQRQATIQPHIEDVRAIRKRIATHLQQDQVDRAQLSQDFAELRAATQHIQAGLHQTLIEAAVLLPVDARQKWRPHFDRPPRHKPVN